MKVSVIIPFYNPGKRLIEAVESAIIQPETGEIIMVNDGSTDNSQEIAEKLGAKYPLITLLQYRVNRGPAYARNFALKHTRYPYIAFLDADDIYLNSRFTTSIEKLSNPPSAPPPDAVYGATINHFDTADLKKTYESLFGEESLIYFRPAVSLNLTYSLLLGQNGSIHLNALTVKKELLEQIGGFDERLRQAEDTDLIYRIAIHGTLRAVQPEPPLAMRNIHQHNTVFTNDERTDARLIFLLKWIKYSLKQQLPAKVTIHFLRSYLGEHPNTARGEFSPLKTLFRKSRILIHLLLTLKSND